jgi:predicted short-subunit dehydrogenase-like oxidoreductase (DUF2520 family)
MRELERDPNAKPLSALAVIGAGRVGTAVARAASAAGIEVALAGREEVGDACREAEAALLCVPDAAIQTACETVAGAGRPDLRFIGHTSGATGLDALAAAAAIGIGTFSLHPLQTIPDGEADLRGAPCAVAGSDAGATALASGLALALGMHPFEVAEENRAAYHAAATMAANFLVALEEDAADLLRSAGVAEPRELLVPLVLRSAANWSERGREALTGPIARGDEATIERHLAALAELKPELLDTYRALAERTRALAREGASA